MNKKFNLETKIRDAAVSLSKANATYKNISKQTSEQLDAANRKVDLTQKELWRISERANEVQKKLLEHRAGVLSRSLRTLEGRNAQSGDDTTTSGYSTPNRSSQMSPITASSVTSVQTASSKGRFEGAHLFAGHADSIAPYSPRLAPQTINGTIELEEKLQAATIALEAAMAKQAEMEQDLSMLRLEKEQVETTLGMEVQQAEDTINSMEQELANFRDLEPQLQALQEEREEWLTDRDDLEARTQEVGDLKRRIDELEGRSGEATAMEGALALERSVHIAELAKKDQELDDARVMWEADQAAWEVEKATLISEMNETVAKLQQNSDTILNSSAQLDECFNSLSTLVQAHGVSLTSQDRSPAVLATSIGNHLETLKADHVRIQEELSSHTAQLEGEVRAALDTQAALSGDLEQVRRERDEARAESQDLQIQLQVQAAATLAASQASSQPPVEYKGDAGKIVAILQPIWAILPSAEARASKVGTRSFRTGSPGSPVTSTRGGSSLSEMDVRSLKTLYDPKGYAMSANSGGSFTIEAFAERVQALVADDRSLVERLIRFAQAHDLLKKNAERAQKLAQDSNAALETYQKQVKTLDERNMSLMQQQAELQDELQWLQETVERLQAEKLDIETQAAEQAETCAQLTEANNKLSARALIMAEESASSNDSVRRQLESQLAECNASLSKTKEEIESMRESQQSQQMALLEELNSVQTENTNLRNQLRAKK
ncbi:hypothetical protein EW026_g656 [Hermanssonia centrifuga]|uniref:Up-regulated during septation protein 1 domain-containing protein n=1 Tax=Hermanssonia centrifuga TaxID=98765 RepID=A0A4S4KU32_9APHY|nr:hypothetical protein EW026_g656 [Hermanssonia centrifuga]